MVLRCASCSGTLSHEMTECPYCGAVRADAPIASPPPSSPTPPTVEERLAAIREQADFATWMRHSPSMTGHVAGTGVAVVFLVVFIGVAIFMTTMFQMAPAPMSYFPLLFVAFGIFGLFSVLKKSASFAKSPLERTPAHVLDERVSVSGGGKNSSASTAYYVTLTREDGNRQEFQTTGKIAGVITRDDVGVAYVKGEHLLDFRRVQV